jgi:hypothetical protein
MRLIGMTPTGVQDLVLLAQEREERAQKRARAMAAIRAAYEMETTNLAIKLHIALLPYLLEEAADEGKPSFVLMHVEMTDLERRPERDEDAAGLLKPGTAAKRVYDNLVAVNLAVTLQRNWTDAGAEWYDMLVFVPDATFQFQTHEVAGHGA